MRRSLLALLALLSCSDDDKTLPPTDPADLQATLEALAAFGQKQPGTEAGQHGGRVHRRAGFATLGLTDVHEETFRFPHVAAPHEGR